MPLLNAEAYDFRALQRVIFAIQITALALPFGQIRMKRTKTKPSAE